MSAAEATAAEATDVPRARDARHRAAFVEMLISSLLSLTASLVLSIDAIRLAENPHASLSCDFSAKVSCSTVGLSWQASLLGFPNAFLGLIAEPVVITLAVAALGGTRFPRWFLITAQAIYTIGLGFAFWLFYEAYYNIGALCPWCLLVTATTTLVFFSMTRVNLKENVFGFGEAAQTRIERWLTWGVDVWVSVLILAVLAYMVVSRYL